MSPDDAMNPCALPHSMASSKNDLRQSDLPRELVPGDLAAVFHLLETFHRDIQETKTLAEILCQTENCIQRCQLFDGFGFFLAQPPQWDFQLQRCSPAAHASLLQKYVEHSIESGTFAWALRQCRPILLDIPLPQNSGKILFHSLGTRRAVFGMFAGLLASPAAPAPDFRLLSVLLSSAAYAIQNIGHSSAPPAAADAAAPRIEALRAPEPIKRHLATAPPPGASASPAPISPAAPPEGLRLVAAGLVHDFQNVLTGVIGNLSLALRYPNEILSLQNWLKDAVKASFRAKDLGQQLTRVLQGEPPRKQIIYLHDLIQDAASFGVQAANIRLLFELPADLWPVEAEPSQISQVIQNIALNAAQAMPGGGKLNLSAQNLEMGEGQLRALAPGRYVKISIRDEGTGIHPADLRRIFDPYFTTKPDGHGLGLATCQSIVQNHKGHITVESLLGHGATFGIYLPAAAASRRPLVPASPARPAGTLLILEEDFQLQELLPAMLAKIGFQVRLAHDSDEAVRLFRDAQQNQQPFDAVILDLGASGKSASVQTLQELRKLDPTIKAILSSGYTHDPAVLRFQEFGFAAAICKPYSIEQFSRTLEQVLSASRS